VYGSNVAQPNSSIRYSDKDQAGITYNAMGSRGELDRDSETNTNEQNKLQQPSSLCNLEMPQYSRCMVYRDSDPSAQPFKPPIPSVLHTDDLELSMGPGSTSCGRVCPEPI